LRKLIAENQLILARELEICQFKTGHGLIAGPKAVTLAMGKRTLHHIYIKTMDELSQNFRVPAK
jgi:hypothetical protein